MAGAIMASIHDLEAAMANPIDVAKTRRATLVREIAERKQEVDRLDAFVSMYESLSKDGADETQQQVSAPTSGHAGVTAITNALREYLAPGVMMTNVDSTA